MSPLPFSQNLEAIIENSEQSENITYVSDSHLKYSYDELISLRTSQDLKMMMKIQNQIDSGGRPFSPIANNESEEYDDISNTTERQCINIQIDNISNKNNSYF